MTKEALIKVHQLKVKFDKTYVLKGIDFEVQQGEIVAIVGGSGAGKSTLLRSLLMLQPFSSGSIHLFGQDILKMDPKAADQIRRRWGVLFQHSALFSSLSVLENTEFPLHEYTHLNKTLITEIAKLKLSLVGLPPDAAYKSPAELSGGMQKRAALARALVLDPELLFLDEPTSGLDPESAGAFDELMLTLRETLGLTLVMVTHDMDTLVRVPDKIAFLGEGKLLGIDPLQKLIHLKNPLIQTYFSGPRGRVAIDEEA